MAERVLEQLEASFVLEDRQVFVGASLGIASGIGMCRDVPGSY